MNYYLQVNNYIDSNFAALRGYVRKFNAEEI
jgi:hypothetical protein